MTTSNSPSQSEKQQPDVSATGETEHFGFYVPVELKERVRRASIRLTSLEDGRMSMSDIGREALVQYLARREDDIPDRGERRDLVDDVQVANNDPDESGGGDRSDSSSTSDPAASRVEEIRQLRDDS